MPTQDRGRVWSVEDVDLVAEVPDHPPPMVGARAHFHHDLADGLPGEEFEQLRARELLRSTGSPSAVAPCSWKYLFEMSMPMMLTILPMDPPSRVRTHPVCVLLTRRTMAPGVGGVHSIAMLNIAVWRGDAAPPFEPPWRRALRRAMARTRTWSASGRG